MRSLLRLTKAEFYKGLKGKGLLITLAIVISAMVFMSLIYGISVEEYKKLFPEAGMEYEPQTVIQALEERLIQVRESYDKGDITKREYLVDDYQLRAEMRAFQYIIDNDLKYGEYDRYMEMGMILKGSAQSMIIFVLSSATLIVGIIASVMAASAISDETNQGTMRLLLMNPVNRISLIAAKILSIMANLAIIITAMVITSIAMGFIIYPNEPTSLLIVFNAAKVALIPFWAGIVLQMSLLMVYSFMIVCLILAITSIFRSKVFGVIMGVVLCTNILATALTYRPSLAKFFSLTVLTNMDFNMFFTTTGNILGQISLPMAILIYIMNAIVLLGISAYTFMRQDID